MAENSAIEWTDHTFNPWWGCQKVSPACDHCYAERDAKRFAPGRVLWGVGSERRTFEDKHWSAPVNWNDKARESNKKRAAYGMQPIRPRVFCASMADWLDLDAPLDQFVRLLDLIRTTPELDWLLLSKRIGNWRKRLADAHSWHASAGDSAAFYDWTKAWLTGAPPANVWLGATVVNQEEADRDIPKLLAVPARVRFLSIEPMLGPIDLQEPCTARCPNRTCFRSPGHPNQRLVVDSEQGGIVVECICSRLNGLHWVIAGGESGPHARPMHPDWPRSLRDQCAAAGVPFLFKQWGEWLPEVEASTLGTEHTPLHKFDDGRYMVRVGKKAAGRLLDGRTHDEFPSC